MEDGTALLLLLIRFYLQLPLQPLVQAVLIIVPQLLPFSVVFILDMLGAVVVDSPQFIFVVFLAIRGSSIVTSVCVM